MMGVRANGDGRGWVRGDEKGGANSQINLLLASRGKEDFRLQRGEGSGLNGDSSHGRRRTRASD